MPTFMVSHTVPDLTRERLRDLQRRAQDRPAVRWLRQYANFSAGTMVSEFDAPSVETLQEWLHEVGLPFDYVMQAEVVGSGRELVDQSDDTDFAI